MVNLLIVIYHVAQNKPRWKNHCHFLLEYIVGYMHEHMLIFSLYNYVIIMYNVTYNHHRYINSFDFVIYYPPRQLAKAKI